MMHIAEPQLSLFDYMVEEEFDLPSEDIVLPTEDNTTAGLQALLAANVLLRNRAWPTPYDHTTHALRLGDARDLSWIENESVHLVVTDVCIPRKKGGRHYIMPLHADIQVRARRIGLDCLTPIIWHKIANGVTEAAGNGAGFYGKPYQPGAIVKNDVEYILFLRKGGQYRSVTPIQKALSMLNREEMQSWLRSLWTDIRGTSTRNGHPAPYPVELAERLIRMFSFAGDTILDPFLGTGATSMGALITGRNSIGNEIEPAYLEYAQDKLVTVSNKGRDTGATRSSVCRIGF